ncbi:tellurite resistance/C4-dicarboxylate transporter family protein [Sporosarcina sp. Marseille-Q4063]|uniref:tellurite resistance/C4-dicarboxylate transporter family protein n=1 Tax=Sporosarcina sp. Marseille-Q4063 TaxID=2810514 RepID=UPI001BB05C88|nr:tellurite resistance/C4-dicarboxylate transporter family protein [Sporosarcina sp. Marseille-Q4063]QUW21416.1 tellurite resistance/C4-dicarboxylate transporter family protein [Sporosarcina sp. Marseille-Q4063]
MGNLLKHTVFNLFSGYFSVVMATGALSIALHLLGMHSIAQGLLYVNIGVYLILWILTILRLVYFSSRVLIDITSHSNGPGFFTLVAGTCVFGSQLIIITENSQLASYLWGLGIVLWLTIMYIFFTAVTIRKDKPVLSEGINGAWLIAAVATQSISVLGTLLSDRVQNGQQIILFFTLCMFLLGCMLYLNIITLIFYRFTFLELKHDALTPPYWINMGAVAITTLAGSTLLLHAENWPLLVELTPFIKGFTLFFWITGTWWIPLLFMLMIWRHFYHRYSLKYDPQFWGMAFPLAMYTTSTFQLSKALQLPFLIIIPKIMVFISILAWLAIFTGMLHHLYTSYRKYRAI